MAVVRRVKSKRVTRWIVDYRDADGKRRHVRFKTSAAAHDFKRQVETDKGGDPHVRFKMVAEHFLTIKATKVRPQTMYRYRKTVDNHLLPRFRNRKMSTIQSSEVVEFMALKLDTLGRLRVLDINSLLKQIFDHGRKYFGVSKNPALGIGAELKSKEPEHEVLSFTAQEVRLVLETTLKFRPWYFPLFFTLARAGLRINEALALEWADIDMRAKKIHVTKTWVGPPKRRVGPPKTRSAVRKVDMSGELVAVLYEHKQRFLEEKLRHAWKTSWVFWVESNGHSMKSDRARRAMKDVLKKTRLPLEHSPQSFRHTFACLHLRKGTSPKYIKDQLGHARYETTINVYGRSLHYSDHGLADKLDNGFGQKRLDWGEK